MSASKIDIATKIKFGDVCRMLEKIKSATGARQKESILQKYIDSFNEFSKQFKEQHGANECEYSFYPVLRCLVPGADNSRGSYGIQLTTMGRLYIKVLNLAPNGDDARKLNQTDIIKGTSDYADVVYSVMQGRSRETTGLLSLADIHQLLDIIAKNDRRQTEVELTKFIEAASPLEQKWLIRIILKRLHIGLGEQKIFSLYHPLAKEFYSRTTDLKRVCECVDSGEQIDMTDSIQPLQFIRPMLCELLDITKIENMLNQSVYYLETKMDGERFQIHMQEEKYKYISRNGKDFTMNFGATASEGNLTPLIANSFKINVKNIILDGEMMVWDKDLNSYRVKGENYDVKSLQRGSQLRPCFVAYDVLYLNGSGLIDKPYAERVALLEKIITEQTGVIMMCKRIKIKNSQELISSFNEALEAQEEGVVIKSQNSVYKPGVRNGGWYKIKPDYINGMIKEFDLLIIGGYWNRKRTFIDSYILGAYKKENENNEYPVFYSVTKVGLGLSFAQRLKLNNTLKPHWNDRSKIQSNGDQQYSIDWGHIVPDVWIDPTKSTVLQIKATELAETSTFRTSHTLRFPRIEAVRDDKSWHDCMTVEEFNSLCRNESGVAKINKRNLTTADLAPSKKIKLSTSKNQKSLNNPYASVFRANEVTKISTICDGLQFCILSTSKGKVSIDQLKAMAIRYGGKVVENPSLDTKKCICVAGDLTSRVRRLMSTGRYNIVTVDWMTRSFGSEEFSGSMAQPKPRDMISMTFDMEEEFKTYYDDHGDSFTDEIDDEELKIILRDINLNNAPVLDQELAELEEILYDECDLKNIFRRMNGYFFSASHEITNILAIAKLIFLSKGGSCLEEEDLNASKKLIHVFIDRARFNKNLFKDWILKIFGKPTSRLKVVSYNWILDCDEKGQVLDQTDYLLYENDKNIC